RPRQPASRRRTTCSTASWRSTTTEPPRRASSRPRSRRPQTRHGPARRCPQNRTPRCADCSRVGPDQGPAARQPPHDVGERPQLRAPPPARGPSKEPIMYLVPVLLAVDAPNPVSAKLTAAAELRDRAVHVGDARHLSPVSTALAEFHLRVFANRIEPPPAR